ncbi:MAG: NAD(P)/FAD-dependent oxidoreductase [Pseudomonadota bacterium]
MTEQVDAVVIGAGVVGLAVARELAMAGREVLILEREDMYGSITSSRNSEVIHAGIYYAKNSLKAQMCVAGKHMLYAYCRANGIPHNNCGKLIVACSGDELEQFDGIARRAWDNGVEDLRKITRAEAQDLEPELDCHGALLSPSTGIVDSHTFMLTLLGEAESQGAMLVLNTPVDSVGINGEGFHIRTGGAEPMELVARAVINSAGLDAPGLAQRMDGLPETAAPEQWIAKGNYFSLTVKAPFERLIYPAPVAGGLGIHLTLDMAGRARFGPDVEWIDAIDYSVDPARGDSFYGAIRRYWPGLPDGTLAADYSGIRPKLARKGAKHAADFRVSGAREHGLPGYVGLYGIESPGLTSALAIGSLVQDTLADDLR